MKPRTRRGAAVRLAMGIVWLGACVRAAAAAPTLLFDEAHGQQFTIEKAGALDLSALAKLFRAAGARVESNHEPLTAARLSGADGLVVSGPFAPFAPAEIEAITGFVDHGGRLALMLHIPQPVSPLLERLGVDFSNGIIREPANVIKDDPLNFHVTALRQHAVTQHVEGFDVFGAWALLNRGANVTVIAQTSPTAWVDLNANGKLDAGDAVQSFAVAVAGQVGRGGFVVFGDDAIFQNQFLTGGNVVLARNLGAWLGQGARSVEGPEALADSRGRKRKL